MDKMSIFFLSIEQKQRRGRSGATCRRWTATLPGMAAVGKWGNGERRSRAPINCPHLGRRQSRVGGWRAVAGFGRGGTISGGGELRRGSWPGRCW
jgi:hypothetical protein